jgi:hypothetical protein
MTIKLYHHKTDGGAEYLMDNFTQTDWCNKCEADSPNDGSGKCDVCGGDKHKEGIINGSKYIVRIDGDITTDAELTIADEV